MAMATNPSSTGPAADSELHAALGQLRPWFRRSLLFTLAAGILVLAPSVYMLEVYDRVLSSRNTHTLLMLSLLVLLAFVVMQVLEWAHEEEMRGAGMRLDQLLTQRVFQATFHARLLGRSGASAQPMADLQTLREFLGSPVFKAALESPVALVILVLLFAIHPLLGWAALAGAAIQGLIACLNTRAVQPHMLQAQRSANAAQLYADGALQNAQALAGMGLLRPLRERWDLRQRDFLAHQAQASRSAAMYTAAAKAVQVAWGSLLLGSACWLLLRGRLDAGAGMLVVASILGGLALRPLTVAVSQWQSVTAARQAWHRLAELLGSVPPPPAQMPLPAPRGLLQAENLVVTPPGANEPVLRGVSFVLQPGEVLAVTGPSAAGKSCLARALVGLWPSSGGKVRLDGADVHSRDKSDLGPHLGYLPQEVELFDGTLADNVARYGPPDPARLEAAIRAAGLDAFIAGLPEGADTELGGGGSRLSGGQRQRIGLARALYGPPVFVVLDEPNAHLDDAGDAALVRAIAEGKARGSTFVVVTHRSSVMPVVDKILYLSAGTVQAFGPREQVLAALRAAEDRAAQGAGAAEVVP